MASTYRRHTAAGECVKYIVALARIKRLSGVVRQCHAGRARSVFICALLCSSAFPFLRPRASWGWGVNGLARFCRQVGRKKGLTLMNTDGHR